MLTDPQDLQNMANRDFRDLASEEFDTRTLLRNAVDQAIARKYEDFLIVDIDSHHYETEAFAEIAEYIDDPVMRLQAKFQGIRAAASPRNRLLSGNGRPHHAVPGAQEREGAEPRHRDITLTQRWMDAIGVDMTCCFPTPMLALADCPRIEVEVALARAYNRWLCDKILAAEPRIRSMLYLPFNDPEATYEMVEEFGDRKGVIGFMVTAPHYRGVYDNAYMKTYPTLAGARPAARLPRRLHLGATRASSCPTASSPCTRWASPSTTWCT